MNADGHHDVNKAVALVVGVVTVSAGIGMGLHWLLLLPGYLFATFLCDPDRDQRRTIDWPHFYRPAEAWDIIWMPYAKNTSHRGPSHWPGWGALGRLMYLLRWVLIGAFLYGLWQNAGHLTGQIVFWMIRVILEETVRLAEVFAPVWLVFWLGMSVADTMHLGADLSSTNVKRAATKFKQERGRA